MSEEWRIEDAKVLIYLSEKRNDFAEVSAKAQNALKAWQDDYSHDAKEVLLYWIQTSSAVADPIFSQLSQELHNEINLAVNLELLEGCSLPRVSEPALLDELWHLLGATETVELAEQIAHIIVLLLPNFIRNGCSLPFKQWWPLIHSSLTKTEDRKQISAGLKAWLACLTNSFKMPNSGLETEILDVIRENAEDYFEILEAQVTLASKIALQILDLSLEMTSEPIKTAVMEFNPQVPGVRDAWTRYISLVEILGIDTSIHQTADGLPDFAALLSASSPIPPRWAIALINVGLCQSNTEGIRVLTMHLIMALQQSQMHAIAKFPKYAARTLFPRFLQTPNFIILNQRCLQAEHIQDFTRNVLYAFLEEGGVQTIREFIFEFSQFLLEHAHSFEAPRALVAKVLLEVLPPNCLTSRESVPLLAAARATVLTYNSKALADLYYDLIEKVVAKAGPEGSTSSKELENKNTSVLKLALEEWGSQGPLTRSTLTALKHLLENTPGTKFEPPKLHSVSDEEAETLFDIHSHLQLAHLENTRILDEKLVNRLIIKELESPRAMSANKRKQLSGALELAFNYVPSTTYEWCEQTFSAFSEIDTRYAALRCYRRSKPTNVALRDMEVLWTHIKDATLRIIDRTFHLAFIDMLTEPGVVSEAEPPVDMCIEIVELSVLKRNLLVPLARGLARFGGSGRKQIPVWVFIVMARIFAFVQSPDYTVRLEEMVAHEFDIYEKNWGEPESHARAVAAEFLHLHCNNSNQEACNETIQDTLEQADLEKRITGSLDNLDAHRRVLYYQILILLQRGSSRKNAMEVLEQVRSSLETEANPPVRMQAEWLVGVIGACHASATAEEFTQYVSNSIHGLKIEVGVPPRVLGSLIRISMLLYYSCVKRGTTDEKTSTRIGEELVLHLIPLATSNKAVVRHRAISALYILNLNQLSPQHLVSLVASVAKVNEGGVKNSSYQNESFLWDVLDMRLGPVCGGICSTVFDRFMPNTLLESDFKALKDPRSSDIVGPCWSESNIVKQNRHGDPAFPEVIAYRERIVQEAVNSGAVDDFSRQIQTKSGTFDVEYQARRTSLVVVATLCDKPVNLGAITRLSDALGVSKLAMRDTSILEDSQYKSTALTAEKWIPIEQVTEDGLVNYLLVKKSEGYTLVGIEQTDTSKKLSASLQFPEKTVLMMGHERQGIPAEILAVLDACVEIEQLGYVRSMNIQTATAVVVHAYNQNHGPNVHKVDYAPS